MILKNLRKNPKKGMTLVELMMSMAIFALIMTMIMTTVHSMTLARIKNMNRLALTDELYFFSEQFFTAIKEGGTLDYEEYWNRATYNTATQSGHYQYPSGVGNFGVQDASVPNLQGDIFGENPFYCRSQDATHIMTEEGCAHDASLNTLGKNVIGNMKRYGQYELQFWDYNSNADGDGGDQNGDGNIVGDEDDVNLFNGPEVFSGAILELYLKNTVKNQSTRTFFRWNIARDPNAPSNEECVITTGTGGYFEAGENCIGNIQILKMNGFDEGLEYNSQSATASGIYDGKIDTWKCETGWNCQGKDGLATGLNAEWKNLFPNSVTVRKFRLDAFPKKDPWLSAGAKDCTNGDVNCISPFIHPYVRFSLEMGFSHGARRAIKGENPTISLSTTVNLDDFR